MQGIGYFYHLRKLDTLNNEPSNLEQTRGMLVHAADSCVCA